MNNVRLQKIIADRGFCSRRRAEQLIIEGKVKVNGQIVNQLGAKFDDDVIIEIGSHKLIKKPIQLRYLLFYKPKYVVTTLYDPQKRKTIKDFLKKETTRLYPIGRLDFDVEGLLLITNDGKLANAVSHPKYNYLKTYEAIVEGIVLDQQIQQLLKGVIIEENHLAIAKSACILKSNKDQSTIEITVNEGHKHHIKNMIAALNLKLISLKRTKIENLTLKNLKPGQYENLTDEEIKYLYKKFNKFEKLSK